MLQCLSLPGTLLSELEDEIDKQWKQVSRRYRNQRTRCRTLPHSNLTINIAQGPAER